LTDLKKNINEIKMEKKISEDVQVSYSISENELINLRQAIATKDEKKLEILLKRIPLKFMKFELTTKLLIDILDHLESNSFTPGLKIVLRYWSGMQTGFDEYEGEIYPIIPSLFLDYSVPFRNLYYLMEALRDTISVLEIALELFEKGSGDQLNTALRNLFDMVGEPSGELYRTLYDEALLSKNQVAIDFMGDLQSYYTKPVAKPKYIFNITATEAEEGEEVEELTEESDLVDVANDILETEIANDIPFEDVDFCAKYLTSGLTRFGLEVVDIEETQKLIKEKLSKLTVKQREEYMGSFLSQDMVDKMNANEILLQILGPANPIVNGDFSQIHHVCFKYGGCRMLFCNCFELDQVSNYDDTGSDNPYYPNIPQWFTGKCQQCRRVITKRCYAVRRPLPQGGWRGTFCSWNCVHLSGDMDDELSITYADMADKRINEFGITDRVEPNIEELLKQAREEDPEGYQFKEPVLE
jgi:hypothetical protein